METKMRQERYIKGWTAKYVAKQIGVTVAAVQKMETGKRKPSFWVLVRLEDLYGMDYRDLFNLPQRQLRKIEKMPGRSQAV